ncbi:MarR family transcriptional regulator [Mycobacterium sp. ACS4331]|uniref:MarR family winged helix-turn-helix transcriptional regulator n=1 Tax=Mycobacterium sp. ACS4331 TaxID=1834121 RepID=UPI0008016065|nr:MarR family transcriptional regulator [Mycobacterium sp. ACS4331]OBF28701.1 hypothetical protein A5727_25075 [Mycobacterium sp. ACS4331]
MDDTVSPDSGSTAAAERSSGLPGLDEAEQRAWQHFLDSSTRMLETLDRTLKRMHKLTLTDVLLLGLLAESEGGAARMSDLANELALIPSRVTAQVSRLESLGLLSRRPCPDDRRCVLAHISQHGRARLALAHRTYAHVVRALYLNQLTRQQVTALGHSCRRLSDALRGNSR